LHVFEANDSCDIAREMFQSGELKVLFEEKGIVMAGKATA
jgi:hypothetical protein